MRIPPRIDDARGRAFALDDANPSTRPESPRALRRESLGPPRPGGPTRDLTAFYASLHRAESAAPRQEARAASAQARLDQLRDDYAGPYRAFGEVVSALPMFRMNGGANQGAMRAHERELDAIAAKAGVSGAMARLGCASPRELVTITQALIDHGKLPPGPADLASRIRAMQWAWGIGVDCAAYTHHALRAATGRSAGALRIRPLGYENFRGLGNHPAFRNVPVTDVRPGDVITLDARPPETVGHNVIVRGRTVMDEDARATFAALHGGTASQFLGGSGPFHAIEVDSSWGAGPFGADYGGVRRETWIYDAAAKAWGFVDVHETPSVFKVSGLGPATLDTFHGAYRSQGTT